MPTHHRLHRLASGWLELESDPGLFTLLLEDFGVRGVQLEEVYDLQQPLDVAAYGFVFLFQWSGERRGRRKSADRTDAADDGAANVFFARQMVANSCGTHALLSVLLNRAYVHLGDTLERLRELTRDADPETRGWAIGNMVELARAHNSHAKPVIRARAVLSAAAKAAGRIAVASTYHFVGYVPVDGRLYELDGLKQRPVDHGPWTDGEDWTVLFRRVIGRRVKAAAGGGDARFNLMALVPDRRAAVMGRLNGLRAKRLEVSHTLWRMWWQGDTRGCDGASEITAGLVRTHLDSNDVVMGAQSSSGVCSSNEYSKDAKRQCLEANNTCNCQKLETNNEPDHIHLLNELSAQVENLTLEIKTSEGILQEENEKRNKFKIDDCRRTHNYDQFISTFLSMLAQQGMLADLIEQNLNTQKKKTNPQPLLSVESQSTNPSQAKSKASKTNSESKKSTATHDKTQKCKRKHKRH